MADNEQADPETRREEAIAPIRREPQAPAAGARTRVLRLPLPAVIAVVLAVLLGGVFFVLPRVITDRTPAAPASAEIEAPRAPVPELTAAEAARLKASAEAALAEVLELDERLKARSAAVWNPSGYEAFDTASREGDAAYLAEDVRTADERYSAALELGRDLIAQSDEIMSAALDAGDAALAAGNAGLAAAQYQIVLGVDPENARAEDGAARAGQLPEVLEQVGKGDLARRNGDLETARDSYRAALAIDARWAPAEQSLAEVTTEIANARYDRQLSAGLAALADHDYRAAETAFESALEVRPDSVAARDGLEQAGQGQKLDAIKLAEIRALAFERRELWDKAIERYEAALATDPTLEFAVEGLARARSRSDLDRKLENLIQNPRLLLDDEILADARSILDEALPLVDTGQRIAGQAERLGALIEAAARPVTVRLTSDRQTEVTVYRVGALGVFAEKEIEVRPGTYTIIGSRNGYRDVRRTFTVLPGRPTEPIRVVCVEPI